MSSWRECKLGDLGTLQRGRSRHRPRYAFHLYGGEYPFIQTGEIREAKKYIDKYEQTYNEAGLAQSKLWKKGTLCITIAANIAELAILKFDACFPDSVLGFIPDERIADVDFIFYTLTYFQKQLKHIGEGSVQDNINLGTFENITFPIPPLEEQKAIAEVLSSLDDKIDLLRHQNQTLEDLAQTLFRQWFIEEAKEEWEESTVGDITILKSGKSRPKEESESNNIPIYGGNGVLGFTHQHNVDGETIIIGRVGAYCGSLYIENRPIWVSDNALIAKPQSAIYSKYLFYILKENELNSMAEGSSHPLLTQEPIKSIQIFLPPESKLEEFNEQVDLWYEKINQNKKQIQTLENLRDTLLPKLLSGEVRVEI